MAVTNGNNIFGIFRIDALIAGTKSNDIQVDADLWK